MSPDVYLTMLSKSEDGWISTSPAMPIDSFEWSMRNDPGSGTLEGADVRIGKRIEPEFRLSADGQLLDGMRIDVRFLYRGDECLSYVLENCIVRDLVSEGNVESFSVSYGQIEWRWTGSNGEQQASRLDLVAGRFQTGPPVDLAGPYRGRSLHGAVDVFLKLPGFVGNSDDREHLGWLDALDFQLTVSHQAVPDSASLDHDIHVTRRPDQISPPLADACVQARLLPDVALEVVSLRERSVLLAYRFRECYITRCGADFKYHPESGEDALFERLSITFKSIEFQYFSPKYRNGETLLGGNAASVAVPHSRLVPKSAFIIMWMDPTRADVEEVHKTIVSVCQAAGVTAVRADDIQHSDQVTDVVLERIRTSEFVIADLTGERPNVYYEVGHAHAVGKKPVLVRRRGSPLHFDLASHNVKEYTTIDDLRRILSERIVNT